MPVTAGHRMSVRRWMPITTRRRVSVRHRHLAGWRRITGTPLDAGYCRTSGLGAPLSPCRLPPDHRLHQWSGFGWPKPLKGAKPYPPLVQVTLISLCSTNRHKDNNFCSTLYMVRALFVLSMWDISQFSLFILQHPTHIS